jgi:MFS family permease
VVFVVLFGASRGAVTLVRPAFVADIYGRERYGAIAGALAAFVTVATAAAPLSGGAAYDLFGAYDPLLWTFAALSAVSAGLVLLVRAETGLPAASHGGSADDTETTTAPLGATPALAGSESGRRERTV